LRVSSTIAAGVPLRIALSISGLPNGVTPTFDPPSITAGGSATLTLGADPSAPLVSGVAFTVSGVSGSVTHTASGAVTVQPPPGPPTAQISHPADNSTVSGTVEVDATAEPGGGSTLSTIRLLVDGESVSLTSTSPAVFSWDSTKVTNGPHTLVIEAEDADLSTGLSSLVHVTVNNAPPPTPPSKKGGCATGGSGVAALLGLFALRRRRTRQGSAGKIPRVQMV
jgi:hypothetical protein